MVSYSPHSFPVTPPDPAHSRGQSQVKGNVCDRFRPLRRAAREQHPEAPEPEPHPYARHPERAQKHA